MIYTVTLNPALDRTIWVEDFIFDDTCRIKHEEMYPGGKGIDVSRMIATLGGDSVALGFLGGFTGLEMEGRLLNEGIPHDFVRIGGETRTNIIIHSEKSGEELKINAAGPEIKPAELGLLLEKIRSLKPAPTIATISGSVPPGLSPRIYSQLTLTFEAMGARVILDADGEPLTRGIAATPYMIKPNRYELERLVERELPRPADMVKAARDILEGELEVVVISVGEDGVYVVTSEGGFHCIPPAIECVNSVGSGDSTVAGIAWGLDAGKTLEEAVKLGVACGAATAMTEGTAQGNREDVETVLPKVEIQPLPV